MDSDLLSITMLSEIPEGFRSGFAALIGPANAGKSTLLNRIVGSKISIVSPKPQTTRTRVLGVKTMPESQVVFLDTPGFMAKRHKGELARFLNESLLDAASEVDVTVLVFDAAKAVAEHGLVRRLRSSIEAKRLRAPAIIALNKVDLVRKDLLLPLMAELAETFRDLETPPELIPLSAKNGEGIELLLKEIESRLPEGPPYFPQDTLTDQPEQALAAEIIREKLFRQLNEELPYSIAVQVEGWEETERALVINALVLVERVSQRGIVVGAGGQKIKAVGTAARLELERIFGLPVHLELYVKVEEDWTKTRRGLRRAGYREDGYPGS